MLTVPGHHGSRHIQEHAYSHFAVLPTAPLSLGNLFVFHAPKEKVVDYKSYKNNLMRPKTRLISTTHRNMKLEDGFTRPERNHKGPKVEQETMSLSSRFRHTSQA